MSAKVFNVLFLCTGNSARSILGEAAVNHLPLTQGRFRGFSAGSQPRGEVNPFSIELLQRRGISTEGLRSKRWDEFAALGAPVMDFVFTVCDQAAGETCPIWPGRPTTAHWGMPDPAAVEGTHEQKLQAFAETFQVLCRRIERFARLPFDTLDPVALQRCIRNIGAQ
ncbi:MAG: arsenate reductase ArsC [Panacagrimonas sp.]